MDTKEQAEIPLDNLDLLRERLNHSRKRLHGKPAWLGQMPRSQSRA